jgi:2C-methyl-D-erythritol 2,4-cyclodiphosphate synthase
VSLCGYEPICERGRDGCKVRFHDREDSPGVVGGVDTDHEHGSSGGGDADAAATAVERV